MNVGTDIAMVGVWDQSRSGDLIPPTSMKGYEEILADDAEKGRVFLLQLEGDWSGEVDVFVDSSPGVAEKARMKRFQRQYRLSAPTGRLVVGGAEDYRAERPQITDASSLVAVDPGDYALACFALEQGAELPDSPDPEELEAAVGSDSHAYYRYRNRWVARGFWLLLLVFPLAYLLGWVLAGVATLVIVLSFFHAAEWYLKRDPRYVAAERAVQAALLAFQDQQPAAIAFELRRLPEGKELSGGILNLGGTLASRMACPGQPTAVASRPGPLTTPSEHPAGREGAGSVVGREDSLDRGPS